MEQTRRHVHGDGRSGRLGHRLTALGRAHDLVRPVSEGEGKAALLGDLISVLLAPYAGADAFAGRIRVAVLRLGIGEGTATTLAMVIHELATNSVKHGALSVDEGALDVSAVCDDTHVVLTWAEEGGPPVAPPERSGFGSKMIARSFAQQFEGAITYDWRPAGPVVTLQMLGSRLIAWNPDAPHRPRLAGSSSSRATGAVGRTFIRGHGARRRNGSSRSGGTGADAQSRSPG